MAVSYNTLKHKRSAQNGQVTRISEAIATFDPLLQSIHVLKALRERLLSIDATHHKIVEELLEHEDADYQAIDASMEHFRILHCNTTADLEMKIESLSNNTDDDERVKFDHEISALKFHLAEFTDVMDNYEENCLDTSELRMRLKDLQPIFSAFVTNWNQLFKLADNAQKEVLKEDRKIFNAEYYKVAAWFDKTIASKAPVTTQSGSSYNLKLPKLELQSFDGSPDSWIAFRDSFKSLVHNLPSLSNAIKFRYLKSAIIDKNSPINHLLESEDGYDEAWQAVIEFYDDNRRIVDCHFKGILSVKPMNVESHEELQRVLNEYSLHIASLERMHNEQELYRAIIAHIVLQRIDARTRDLWETENKGSIPFWPDLQRFLKERRKTLSTIPAIKSLNKSPSNNYNNNKSTGSKPTWSTSNSHATNKASETSAAGKTPETSAVSNARAASNPTNTRKCFMCNGDHRLSACPQFLNLTIPQRLSKVKELRICTNCLGTHFVSACKSSGRCRSCQQQHHTMLHMEQVPLPAPTFPASTHSLQMQTLSTRPLQASAASFPFTNANCYSSSTAGRQVTLLMTAIVQIQDANGGWHSARAFLDTASDSNYISTSVAAALNLPISPTHVEVKGLGGARTTTIRKVTTSLVGNSVDNVQLELLVTPKVTNPTPIAQFDPKILGIPSNVALADPSFCVPGKIDILIGNGHYGDFMRDGRIKLDSGPVLLNSVFGWLFSGSVPQSAVGSGPKATHAITTHCHHSTLIDLRNTCEKFYKLEDYRNEKRFLTDEEAFCETMFEQFTRRLDDGRFEVTHPFKDNVHQLVNNYRSALCQFFANEKRLQKNDALLMLYIEFMREYEALGHMTEIDISHESHDAPAFYFPHHAVEKPDSTTTKLRVVFNGSSRTASGLSLNDTQCVGPQIQSDAFTLSVRFRQHSIVIKADIAKMYRQIEVVSHHRCYQRIFWRESPQDRLKVYALNTVTYGTASASFESTRCLKQLAIENKESFPKAAEEIANSFYVDDYISGAGSIQEAISLAKDVKEIIGSAQMKLRKFNSNNAEFLQSIPVADREAQQPDTAIKALGIKWDPVTDTIGFDIKPIAFQKITRRIILSEIMKIYDPEGLIGPVTFRFKLFLKAVFKLSLPWDAQLTENEAGEWTQIASTFPELSKIRIPRHAIIDNFTDVQLHGFCDASDLGYGAAVYIRSQDANGNVMCNLICAKSRVAPNEYRSTARLELCGAVILANLMTQVSKALNLPFSKKVCWSDSAIALHWLRKSPAQLQTFVANRVSEIQELSSDMIWRHIRGPLNPGDLMSRGLTPEQIIGNLLWWNGPYFLLLDESQWPSSIVSVDPSEPSFSQELKKVESTAFATSTSTADPNPFLELTDNLSRTWVIKKKLAPVMRFVFNARTTKTQRRFGPIKVDDMLDAEHAIARMCQAKHFSEDFIRCAAGKPIPRNSRIKNLDPIWDSKLKIMRVGGRLNLAQQCDDEHKHPIILPNCHFTRLVIRETHQQNLHAGQNATHSLVRLRYWPIRAKHIIKQEVHKCIKCFRVRPRLPQQFMGQLPAERVTPSPTFYHTGVDYAGPFNIKRSTARNAKAEKAYVALFVCLATKAIHMEIVTALTTDAFFAVFDKFVSRRGLPRTMHSDHGLNFVGARNELQELYAFLAQQTVQNDIRQYLAQQEIEWNFIPPRAPEHGGLWEAGVKSMKHHFYRVAENSLLTFEEFDRLKSKIEAILNSRPLTPISNDPSDFSALTAGHFLIGRQLVAKPDRNLTQVTINRLQRWERVLQAQQHFWKRWSRDYLHQLQVRTKNYKEIVPVTVGQLVLIHVDNSPPMHWPIGRITEIYPGKDGITRVASVRTANSTYERPVTKLALLPIDPTDDQLAPAEDVRD